MRDRKPLPALDQLRRLLRYEPATGKLFWLPRPLAMFADSNAGAEASRAAWNARYAHKEAGGLEAQGYVRLRLEGGRFKAHRIAWALFYGKEPTEHIDHLDGNRANNRITNLREADNSLNCKNRAKRSDNTSGVTGVRWHERSQKWSACVKVGGRVVWRAKYPDLPAAATAVGAKRAELGFTERHGT